MKHLLLFCIVFMVTIMPQESPFAKTNPSIKVDVTNLDAILNYKNIKHDVLVYENDKLIEENNNRLKKIQKKIDSIFHK